MKGWRKVHGTWRRVWGRGKKRVVANVIVNETGVTVTVESDGREGDVAGITLEVCDLLNWLKV